MKLKAMPQTPAVFVDLKQPIAALELKDGQEVPLDNFKQAKDAAYDLTQAGVVAQSAAAIRARAMLLLAGGMQWRAAGAWFAFVAPL